MLSYQTNPWQCRARQTLNLIISPSRRLPKILLPHAEKLALLMFEAWWEEDESCGRVAADTDTARVTGVRAAARRDPH